MGNSGSMNLGNLQDLQTVRDWVRFYVSEMNRTKVAFGHGCSNALDEAVYLIQSALSLPLSDISPFLDARITAHERETLFDYLKSRTVSRKPAAYITGEAFMQGHRFLVDERVIVPRSFIGELLDDQLTPWINAPEANLRVLDLCTGSGCIGIYAALAFENATVDCVDLSEDALEVTNANIALYGLESRVSAIHSDLFTKVSGTYDVILTNPPYVNSTSMSQLPKEYLHEPNMALAGGADGMDIIRQIIQDAPKFLKPHGILIIELGNEREFFETAFPSLSPIWLEVSAGDDQVLLLKQGEF